MYLNNSATLWQDELQNRQLSSSDRMNVNTGAILWQNEPQYWHHFVTEWTSTLAPPCGLWQDEPKRWSHFVTRIDFNISATLWQDEPQIWELQGRRGGGQRGGDMVSPPPPSIWHWLSKIACIKKMFCQKADSFRLRPPGRGALIPKKYG